MTSRHNNNNNNVKRLISLQPSPPPLLTTLLPSNQKPRLMSSPGHTYKNQTSFLYNDDDSDFEDEYVFDYSSDSSPQSPSPLSTSPFDESDTETTTEESRTRSASLSSSATPKKPSKKSSFTTEKRSETPETPLDKERSLVEKLFVEGSYKYHTRQDYYAIERSWWDHWACYTNYLGVQRASFEQRLLSTEPPGAINNLALTEPNTSLINAYKSFSELIRDEENFNTEVLKKFPPIVSSKCSYICVPAGVWELLQGAYGGGPEVRVQHAGPIISECCKFELLELVVLHSHFPGEIFPVECYNYWTAGYLKRILMTVFRVEEADKDDVRLVDLSCRAQRTVLREDMTLVLNKIVTANCISFEVKDKSTGRWPESSEHPSIDEEESTDKEIEDSENLCAGKKMKNDKDVGCGLVNMGNTCYMNCVLQALSHTTLLTQYLMGTDWRHDPRIHGPGKIAREYCALLEELMSRSCGEAIEPRTFRSSITTLVPHFSGFQQQDCHEMLNILLDSLCDDLNCAEQSVDNGGDSPEYAGEPAEEWAQAAWERHTKRRWSVVDALFSGQLLSTRECPDCGARTLSCQPFQTLELPIPASPARRKQVVRVYLTTSERLRKLGLHLTLCFTVDSACTVAGLQRRTAEVLNAIGGPLGKGFEERCVIIAHIAQGRAVLDADPERTPVCSHSEYVACVTDAPVDLTRNRLIQVRMCEARAVGPLSLVNTCFLYLPVDRISYARVAVEAIRVFADLSPQKRVEAERKLSELAVFKIAATKRRSPHSSPSFKMASPLRRNASGGDNTKESESDACDNDDLDATPVFRKISNKVVAECAASLFELQECGPWQSRGRRWKQPSKNSTESIPAVISLNAVITAKWKPLCSLRPEECAQYSEDGDAGSSALCLDDCLAAMVRSEELSEENKWRCPRCAMEKKAVVSLQVWRAPPVLVVDFMRFSVQSQYASSKVETRVEYPLKGFDMTPYVKGPHPPEGLCYDLYAVCNHVGTPTCGHYTASVKCGDDDDEWYLFDDAQVKKIEDPNASVVSPEAYLLFYIRRGFDYSSSSLSSSSSSSPPLYSKK